MSGRTGTIIGAILVVGGLIAVAVAVIDALDDSTENVRREAMITKLSDDQQERALEIVADDAQLRRLVGDRDYTPDEPLAWTTLVDGEHLVGAWMKLQFARPLSIGPSIWPIAISAASGVPHPPKKPYIRRAAKLSVENMTEIMVSVDLETSTVVGLSPGGPDIEVKQIQFYGPPPGRGYRQPKGY